MKAAILAILLRFHAHAGDKHEPFEDRTARFTTMASAIEQVANHAACFEEVGCKAIVSDRFIAAGVLIAQTYYETALRRRIWEGDCPKFQCDMGLARGPWQHHQRGTDTDEFWKAFAGLEESNFVQGATRTIHMWAGGANNGDYGCGFARLAGMQCAEGYDMKRVKMATALASQLRSSQ
jgi:hypothetical protein